MDLVELEKKLWEKVRESQAAGRPVRNGIMARRFGGPHGYACPTTPAGLISPALCLIGVVAWPSGQTYPAVERALGISVTEMYELVAGFEGWIHLKVDGDMYIIGRRIGSELERLEAEARAAQMKVATDTPKV